MCYRTASRRIFARKVRCTLWAGLAQLVEHLICNQGVTSSNLVAGTNLFNELASFSYEALSVVDTQWTHSTDSTRDLLTALFC
jgi:hypothetical protein